MGHRDDLWDAYAKTRDPAVREKIIVENIPLVHHILNRLAIPRLSEEAHADLVSQGILGLIDAVDRFEPKRGWRFSTYATLRIRGQILDALRAMDVLPRTARKRVKEVEQAVSKLRMELQREPKDAEVAAAAGMDIKSYRSTLVEANCAVFSIDAAIESDGKEASVSFRDLLCDQFTPQPEELLEEEELYQCLTEALKRLPERLQVLLSLYYFEELTMKEIGQVLELSESRVSQLHARAVNRLRDALQRDVVTPQPSRLRRAPLQMPRPVFAGG